MNRSLLLIITVLIAYCSISYELLIARSLSQLTGEIIISQSWSIGFFILSLGLGAFSASQFAGRITDKKYFFYQLEVLLSFVGMLAVPAILFLHIICQLQGITYENVKIFILLSQALTLLLGFLSGFEVPLVLNIGHTYRFTESKILGWHYLGSMIAGILVAFVFTSHFSVTSSVMIVASINFLIATLLVKREKAAIIKHSILLIIFSLSGLQLRLFDIDHAKVTYFLHSPSFFAENMNQLWKLSNESISLQRFHTPYQTIDIVEKLAYREPMDAEATPGRPEYEILHRLYINSQLQVSQGYEQVYHELFALTPTLLTGKKSKNVLILGGGDGILASYLLDHFPDLEITLVEIDPQMIELAKKHPVLLTMNKGIFNKSKVNIVLDDAFSFLIKNKNKFDALYADLPLPRDDELMRVYSTEFYLAAKKSLVKDGFLVLDTPGTGTSDIESRIGDSLLSAGFPKVYFFGTSLRFAIAANQNLLMDETDTTRVFSINTRKYLGLIEEHENNKQAISIFRPGVRNE